VKKGKRRGRKKEKGKKKIILFPFHSDPLGKKKKKTHWDQRAAEREEKRVVNRAVSVSFTLPQRPAVEKRGGKKERTA